jgi:hypothetical protein
MEIFLFVPDKASFVIAPRRSLLIFRLSKSIKIRSRQSVRRNISRQRRNQENGLAAGSMMLKTSRKS